jgi:hypothetical protein
MFALQHAQLWDPPLTAWAADEIAARLADTAEGWRSWCAIHQTYEGPWRDLVHHSGRVLQALTFAPTGAIVAAPDHVAAGDGRRRAELGLPLHLGPRRQPDHGGAVGGGVPRRGDKFFGFLADAAASQLHRGADLQIMFGIGGERTCPSGSCRTWPGGGTAGRSGWATARGPSGSSTCTASCSAPRSGWSGSWRARPGHQRFLAAAADTAAGPLEGKDQGIWEIRGEPRTFLYSKLMCWVAWTGRSPWPRARREERYRLDDRPGRDQGGHPGARLEREGGAFTQAFGGEDLDASNLMLVITGFLPGDDPRMKATIDATAERLTDKRGLVYRYLAQDGLSGEEGTFLLCTFWLAQAQAMAGEVDQAVATFERAVSAINDVGLLAEEIDANGEMIGNFPQAFSHIGLVNAAWAIAQAQQRRS